MTANEIRLIWMSAGNSYFQEQTIEKILGFANKKFSKIIIMSPNKPAAHTFSALGYDESESFKNPLVNNYFTLVIFS